MVLLCISHLSIHFFLPLFFSRLSFSLASISLLFTVSFSTPFLNFFLCSNSKFFGSSQHSWLNPQWVLVRNSFSKPSSIKAYVQYEMDLCITKLTRYLNLKVIWAKIAILLDTHLFEWSSSGNLRLADTNKFQMLNTSSSVSAPLSRVICHTRPSFPPITSTPFQTNHVTRHPQFDRLIKRFDNQIVHLPLYLYIFPSSPSSRCHTKRKF